MTTLIFIEKLLFPLLATFAGAWLAFNNMRKKQKSDDEKQKLAHAYRWFLEAENCMFTLCDIKNNYINISKNESPYRSLTLKITTNNNHIVNTKEISNLQFLFDQPDEIDRLGFRNYFRINRLFNAYNQTIKNWEETIKTKAEINLEIYDTLDKDGKFEISEKLIEKITPLKLSNYIILAEQTFTTAEICIKDFSQFLDDFPVIINESICSKTTQKQPMKKYMLAPETASCIEKDFLDFTTENYAEIREIIPRHKRWKNSLDTMHTEQVK